MGDYKQEMRDFIIVHKQDIDSMQINKVVKAYIDEFINPMPLISLLDDAGVKLDLSHFCKIMNFLCSLGYDDTSAYTIDFHHDREFFIKYGDDDCADGCNGHFEIRTRYDMASGSIHYLLIDNATGNKYVCGGLEALLSTIEDEL